MHSSAGEQSAARLTKPFMASPWVSPSVSDILLLTVHVQGPAPRSLDVHHNCTDTGSNWSSQKGFLPTNYISAAVTSEQKSAACSHFEVHETFITWLKPKANFSIHLSAQSKVVCGLITACDSSTQQPRPESTRAHSQWVCKSHFNVGQTHLKEFHLLYLLKYSKCPPCIKSHTSVIDCIYQKPYRKNCQWMKRGRSPWSICGGTAGSSPHCVLLQNGGFLEARRSSV